MFSGFNRINFFQDNRPGPDWMNAFIKRWNLSDKLQSTLERSCDLTSSVPKLLYNTNDMPAKRIFEYEDRGQPDCLQNGNESNLFIREEKEKVKFDGTRNYFLLKFLRTALYLIIF